MPTVEFHMGNKSSLSLDEVGGGYAEASVSLAVPSNLISVGVLGYDLMSFCFQCNLTI